MRSTLLLLASAGCVPILTTTPSQTGTSAVSTTGTPIPTVPVTTPAAVVETFDSTRDAVDVLFVMDNSCSMGDDQALLADNADLVVDNRMMAELDVHLGLTTTDLDRAYDGSMGTLATVDGGLWIDVDTADPEAAWATLVPQGVSGSGNEKGMGAAYTALEVERDLTNAGFVRDDAQLAVIVVSDEPDMTPVSVVTQADFEDWFLAYKPDPLDATFHAVAHPKFGAAYVSMAEALGGTVLDIDTASRAAWKAFLLPAFDAIHARSGMVLASVPDESTIVVGYTDSYGVDVIVDPALVTFDPATNRVRVVRGTIPAGLPVWVEYLPL